jgi:SAM-dependent methyltransferase
MSAPHRRPEYYHSQSCEKDLLAFGDSAKGSCYRDDEDAQRQYALMLQLIRERNSPVSLLDFGCGPAHLFDHIRSRPDLPPIRYTGVDISKAYLEVASRRRPEANLLHMNVLESDDGLPEFDYVIANGLFNFRGEITVAEWTDYWRELIVILYRHARVGLAFNVMSKIVDWERDDLLHLPLDAAAEFVGRRLSRHFVIRHDYGKFEYSVFVYRTPATLT